MSEASMSKEDAEHIFGTDPAEYIEQIQIRDRDLDDCKRKYEIMEKVMRQQITVRDQFAMAALTGLLSASSTIGTKEGYCKGAYEFADAMIEASKIKLEGGKQ